MARKYYGWQMFLGRRPYKATLQWQERMVQFRQSGTIRDTLMYLEHPHVFTIGRDVPDEWKNKGGKKHPNSIDCFYIPRGGGVTYHGPGQLIVYPIFNLRRHGKDLKKFIFNLEEGIIRALAAYGLKCRRFDGHTGVWIKRRKIASIGIAVNHWISSHGAAINLTTDLEKYKAINPCGLQPETMTSAYIESGKKITLEEFAATLSKEYEEIFNTSFEEEDLEEIAEMIRIEESTQSL